MKRLLTLLAITLFVTVVGLALPPQASALCDLGQARVIHANSTPFNSAVATTMIYWVAPSANPPTFYYQFTTSNQTFINLLNAALVSGKQVRVTGNVAACPGAGAIRAAGTVVAVFMDYFQ